MTTDVGGPVGGGGGGDEYQLSLLNGSKSIVELSADWARLN